MWVFRRVAFLLLVGMALPAAAAAAEPMTDEQLLEKVRLLMANKAARSALTAVACEYDKACANGLKAQAKAVTAKQEKPGANQKTEPAVIPTVDYGIHTTVLLRDAYSPVAFITGGSDLSQKGASFTLTDDHQNQKTTFVGNGSLMVATYGNVDLDKSALPISHFAFVPGVEWARKVVNGVDTGTESAKFGGEIEVVAGTFDHYLRSSAVYTTDVSTRANLYGIENGWQPANSALWWNVKKRLWLDAPVWLGFYPSLNANYYHAASVGNLANLSPGRDYLWTGPAASAIISFDKSTGLQDFSFSTKYFYLYDVYQPRIATVNYLETGILYNITSLPASVVANSGAISLDVHYTSGRTPQTLERVAEWYAGLNLKLGSVDK